MHSFYEDTDTRQAAQHPVGQRRAESLWPETRASSAWPGLLHDRRFNDSSYHPGLYYHGDPTCLASDPPQLVPFEPEATAEDASLVPGSAPRAGGTAWLSFALGVAFAVLLLVAGLLSVHGLLTPADITVDDEFAGRRLWGTQRNSHSQRRGIVVPLPKPEKGVPQKPSVSVTAARRHGEVARPPTPDSVGAGVLTTAGDLYNGNIDEIEDGDPKASSEEICGRHFYTYCQEARTEFYYNSEKQECIWAAADSVHVCNRGSNRFSSLEACLASCVSDTRVSDHCYESPLFFPCSRQDVVDGQWFFDGRKCTRWGFPQGTCLPAKHRGVFRSLDDCRRHCVHRWDRSCDEVPPAETCSLRQLRHAYFADMQAEGGVRCVNTSRRTLMNRRCLIGSNQFPSLVACRKACVRK